MADTYEIAVDFMDMSNDLRLWARPADLRAGFEPSVGFHAVVGDEDAESKGGSHCGHRLRRQP